MTLRYVFCQIIFQTIYTFFGARRFQAYGIPRRLSRYQTSKTQMYVCMYVCLYVCMYVCMEVMSERLVLLTLN